MPEWFTDWIGGVALLIAGTIAGWMRGIAGKVSKHSTQIAVHEAKIDDIPEGLKEIRDEIVGLRADSVQRSNELYRHMEQMRLEIKRDLATKADK